MNFSELIETGEKAWEVIMSFMAAITSIMMLGGIFAILTAQENAFALSSRVAMISFTVGSISLLTVSNFGDQFSYLSESNLLRSSRYFLIAGISALLYAATNAMLTGNGGITVVNQLQQIVAMISTAALFSTSLSFTYGSYRLFYAVRKMRVELDATE
jgi:uncharacterized membrane protein